MWSLCTSTRPASPTRVHQSDCHARQARADSAQGMAAEGRGVSDYVHAGPSKPPWTVCRGLFGFSFRLSRRGPLSGARHEKGARPLPPCRDAGHTGGRAARLLRVPAQDKKAGFWDRSRRFRDASPKKAPGTRPQKRREEGRATKRVERRTRPSSPGARSVRDPPSCGGHQPAR
jgi:hypothetical protein